MKKLALCTILLTVAIFLLDAWPAAALPPYSWKDLGSNTNAFALNNSRQVAGDCYSYTVHANLAFLWSRGVRQDLGTLPSPYNSRSYATAINEGGMVVGTSYSSTFKGHAFLWTSVAGMMDLGTSLGPDDQYFAKGLNNTGHIVGYRIPSSSPFQRAFIYFNGVMQDLLIDGSVANDINDAGQVVGTSGGEAFLWRDGIRVGLGTLPPVGYWSTSWGYAINAGGQVVGGSYVGVDVYHAFLWTNGIGMKDLGTLPGGENASEAYAVNVWGHVVGWSATSTSGDPNPHAFLYRPDWSDVMLDLNSLVEKLPNDEVLILAYGINNGGQIVAQGSKGHSYLLSLGQALPAIDLLLLQ
jgi:probable HAF family extracellular repeat protein